MNTLDTKNVEITFGPAKFTDIGMITRGPKVTMPIKIVFKRQRRAVRQKMLAEQAKKHGTTICEVKKLWGNGSGLTIPNCEVTGERDLLGLKEWHFEAPGVVGVAVQRAEDGR